jgi:hypothetical protein
MPSSARRWDTDTRGSGVGDARAALPALERLAEAMATKGWIAEEPELHLLPHLRAGAETVGVEIRAAASTENVFEVELSRDGRSGAQMRAMTMALVSTIAEASSHVRQVHEAEFEVVTGMLDGDSPVFVPHGHLVRFRFV